MKVLEFWFDDLFLPIKKKDKLNNKSKIKFILKLISVNFKPWRVAIIFQIELIRVRNTEDINK